MPDRIDINMMIVSLTETNLKNDVSEDDLEGIEQVDQEPDLYRLDVSRTGQAGGHREVDRSQDHHAGDVDGVDHVVPVRSRDEVGGLIDDVHEDGREEDDREDASHISPEGHRDLNHLAVIIILRASNSPVVDDKVAEGILASVDEGGREVCQDVGDPLDVEVYLAGRNTTEGIVSAIK